MTTLDRPGLIDLLGRLGAEDDPTVLDAAREAHRRVSASGSTWADLLLADAAAAGVDSERPDRQGEAQPGDDAPLAADGALSAANTAEAARIIDRLLARQNISSTLREDLAELKRSIAEGTFDAMDARYVRALAKRLGV
jgi:hypothetical protein